MATDLEIFNLTQDINLRKRAAAAVGKAAVYVIGTGSTTANNKAFARAAMGKLATDSSGNFATADFIWYIVLNGDVQTDPTNETAIEYVVNLQWPVLWA